MQGMPLTPALSPQAGRGRARSTVLDHPYKFDTLSQLRSLSPYDGESDRVKGNEGETLTLPRLIKTGRERGHPARSSSSPGAPEEGLHRRPTDRGFRRSHRGAAERDPGRRGLSAFR